MDCSMPGFHVFHYLSEFAQTQVHWVGDAIQPSHPLSPPSPSLNLSQHQGFFSSKLALRIRWPKYWSSSISPSNECSAWFPLGLTGLISLHYSLISKLLLWLIAVLSKIDVKKSAIHSREVVLCERQLAKDWLKETTLPSFSLLSHHSRKKEALL